jgi:hypothetical protein
MMLERVEQRVLGALRLIDRVTGSPLTRPMRLSADNASLVRNARGYYVVTAARGLEQHTTAFPQPPATPALGSILCTFTIHDPQQRYLPRLITLNLPRDPDPAHAETADSLFRPLDVALYPAATAQIFHNWSTIRAAVTMGPDPRTAPALRGALLLVIDEADGTRLAGGISDERGEALVIVPGVPVTKFADEGDGGESGGGGGGGGGHGHGGDEPPVVVNTLPVRLEISLGPGAGWPVNPDVLEANHEENRRLSMPLTLSTGRMEKVTINLT